MVSKFQFVLYYDIDFENSGLARHLYSMMIDPVKFYRENPSQLKCTNKA